jgi:hypothetical protein
MRHRMRKLAQHEPHEDQQNDRPTMKDLTLHAARVASPAQCRNHGQLRISPTAGLPFWDKSGENSRLPLENQAIPRNNKDTRGLTKHAHRPTSTFSIEVRAPRQWARRPPATTWTWRKRRCARAQQHASRWR